MKDTNNGLIVKLEMQLEEVRAAKRKATEPGELKRLEFRYEELIYQLTELQFELN